MSTRAQVFLIRLVGFSAPLVAAWVIWGGKPQPGPALPVLAADILVILVCWLLVGHFADKFAARRKSS